jgi:hypothetical protein
VQAIRRTKKAPPPIRVNLRRHGLVFSLGRGLAQVAVEAGGGGEEGGDAEAWRDRLDQQLVEDTKRAPQSRVYASVERGETPISRISESVTNATSKWQ